MDGFKDICFEEFINTDSVNMNDIVKIIYEKVGPLIESDY
jgi:hypothetical protein